MITISVDENGKLACPNCGEHRLKLGSACDHYRAAPEGAGLRKSLGVSFTCTECGKYNEIIFSGSKGTSSARAVWRAAPPAEQPDDKELGRLRQMLKAADQKPA